MSLHLATGVSMAVTIFLYLTVAVIRICRADTGMHFFPKIERLADLISYTDTVPSSTKSTNIFSNPEVSTAWYWPGTSKQAPQKPASPLTRQFTRAFPPEDIIKVKNLRPSMGNTNGIAFTESAPLISRTLDKLEASHSAEAKTMKDKMNNAGGSAAVYFDRRAQENSYVV